MQDTGCGAFAPLPWRVCSGLQLWVPKVVSNSVASRGGHVVSSRGVKKLSKRGLQKLRQKCDYATGPRRAAKIMRKGHHRINVGQIFEKNK